MNNLTNLLNSWEKATADAKYGVQRVFHDVFTLAAESKTTLIYGADYRDGKPCLVNTVGTMLTTGGGLGIPSNHFGEIVSLFDQINRELENQSVNTNPGYVSPLAAEIFLRHFAPLKDAPTTTNEVPVAPSNLPYIEPSDEEMASAVANMFMIDAPCEIQFNEDNLYEYSVDAIEEENSVSVRSISEPPC